MLKPFIQKKDTHFRNATPIAKALAVAIHRLAFGGVVQRTWDFLGVGLASISKYMHMICKALVDNFFDNYIKTFESQQLEQLWLVSKNFKKITNIPYMWRQLMVSILCSSKTQVWKKFLMNITSQHHSHSVLL